MKYLGLSVAASCTALVGCGGLGDPGDDRILGQAPISSQPAIISTVGTTSSATFGSAQQNETVSTAVANYTIDDTPGDPSGNSNTADNWDDNAVVSVLFLNDVGGPGSMPTAKEVAIDSDVFGETEFKVTNSNSGEDYLELSPLDGSTGVSGLTANTVLDGLGFEYQTFATWYTAANGEIATVFGGYETPEQAQLSGTRSFTGKAAGYYRKGNSAVYEVTSDVALSINLATNAETLESFSLSNSKVDLISGIDGGLVNGDLDTGSSGQGTLSLEADDGSFKFGVQAQQLRNNHSIDVLGALYGPNASEAAGQFETSVNQNDGDYYRAVFGAN